MSNPSLKYTIVRHNQGQHSFMGTHDDLPTAKNRKEVLSEYTGLFHEIFVGTPETYKKTIIIPFHFNKVAYDDVKEEADEKDV